MSRRAAPWVALYFSVTLLPLGVVLLGPVEPDRGFWIEFAIGLGFVGLAMMGMQSILTARFSKASAAFGQDNLLQFHRQAGLVAYWIVLAHPIILLTVEPDFRSFLDPRTNLPRALALTFVVAALTALIVTSLWRQQLRFPYEWWRLSHGILATLVVLIGLVHILQVHRYLDNPWKQALWATVAIASVASVAYVRVIRPIQLLKRPYTITRIRRENAHTWTLAAEPDGQPGFTFEAGQFAFLTIASSPFALEQHPFSIASSATHPDRLEFTVKELGDYTATIGTIPVGSRAYVNGPFGSVILDHDDTTPLVLVAGGIGISPIMSMIRTLTDRRQHRPVTLIYAANRTEELLFREELSQLAGSDAPNLEIVYVVADPPAGWKGEHGFVTADLLERHLPAQPERGTARYVLCGPPRMMESVEQALLNKGVPLSRIDTERFDIGASAAIGPRQRTIRRLVIGLAILMVAAATWFAA